MALILKEIRIFFTAPCLVYNQSNYYQGKKNNKTVAEMILILSTVNDIDSSLTNTIIMYFFDKFGIDSILDISANTIILNATMIF